MVDSPKEDFPRTVRKLVDAYAETRLTAEELVEAIFEWDSTYFTSHSEAFKVGFQRELLKLGVTPQERVTARYAFYEAYFDYASKELTLR